MKIGGSGSLEHIFNSQATSKSNSLTTSDGNNDLNMAAIFVVQMLQELNKAIDGFTDNVELQGEIPTYAGPNGFLNNIIVPIYEVVKAVRSPFFVFLVCRAYFMVAKVDVFV